MKIVLNKNLDTKDVIDAFEKAFVGLKIEFFRYSHEEGEGSHKKDMIKGSMPLGAISPHLVEGEINLNDSMTVAEVEQLFQDEHNLHIQVFRKMGPNWIETTHTDGYSLKQQSELSKESTGL